MTKWWNYDEVKASIFGLVIMLAIILEGFFIPDNYQFSVFYIGIAVSISAAILFNRKFYIFIFFGSLIGYFFKGEIFLNYYWFENILFSLYKSILLIVSTEIGLRFYRAFIDSYMKKRQYMNALLLFIVFVLLVSMVKGFSVFSFCLVNCTQKIRVYSTLSVFMGTFSGVLFFVPFIVMGHKENIDINPFKISQSPYFKVLFVILFLTTTLLLINGIFQFTLYRHIYVLLAFYILASLFYSYYIVLSLNGLFLVTYGILSYLTYQVSDFWGYLESISIVFGFLTITSIISLMLKRYVEEHREQNHFLETSNKQLDKTIDYIYRFFDLSSDILGEDVSKEHFAKETFALTSFLYGKTDASFAYFATNGAIEPIIARGYDMDKIPFLHELHESKAMEKKSLILYKHIGNSIKKHYPKYVFADSLSKIKSATRIYSVFTFDSDVLFIVAHDYYKQSNVINNKTLKRIKDYTALLNRLFKKRYIEGQNRLIKSDIILSFVRTLDLYDHYTKGHSEDVANLSKAIAKMISNDQTFINDVYWAGLLHDIGKLGVQYEILNKKGRLNDEEYEHIKKHVEYSFDVLNKNEDLQSIAKMVAEHHERLDGRGYPKGLSDKEISLGGKIIALSDAVATMATTRPYKKKLSDETIIEEIKKHTGTQFDEKIADLMIIHIKNGALASLNA